MLAALSGKVDSIISYVWKYVIVHICFKVYNYVSEPVQYIYQFVREYVLH